MKDPKITERATLIYSRLMKAFPAPKSELNFKSAFELLIAVILSAQATDKSVNEATPALFAAADEPCAVMELGEEGVYTYIKRIGLARTKARHIIETSRALVERFGGEVPNSREELMTLSGVGEKTSAVVLNVWYGLPFIPVDTHVFRVAKRLGLSAGSSPHEVEKDLLEVTPPSYALDAHHLLLLHGRHICKARRPLCSECSLSDICEEGLCNKV